MLKLVGHERKAFFGPQGVVEGAIGYNELWRLFVNLTKEEFQGSAVLGRHLANTKGN